MNNQKKTTKNPGGDLWKLIKCWKLKTRKKKQTNKQRARARAARAQRARALRSDRCARPTGARSDFTSGGSSADFHVAITEKWTGRAHWSIRGVLRYWRASSRPRPSCYCWHTQLFLEIVKIWSFWRAKYAHRGIFFKIYAHFVIVERHPWAWKKMIYKVFTFEPGFAP